MNETNVKKNLSFLENLKKTWFRCNGKLTIMYLSISKCLECGRCDQIEALASIIFLASYTYSWFCNRSRGMLESMGIVTNLGIKNPYWEKSPCFLEIRKIPNNINARYSIYHSSTTLGSEKDPLGPHPCKIRSSFLQILDYITYSYEININTYSFFLWWITWSLKKRTNYGIDVMFC